MPIYPGTVAGTFVRQPGWTDKSVLVDFFISDKDREVLYKVWGEHSDWPEPLEYRGGEKGITCEMVLEACGADLGYDDSRVKETQFIRAFGRTKAATATAVRIIIAAREGAGR